MNGELRSWNWLVPAIVAGMLFALVLWLWSLPGEFAGYCAGGAVLVVLFLSLQAISGYRAFFRDIYVEQTERLKRAQTLSELSVRLEAARGVHPEIVKAFLAEQNRVWALKQGDAPRQIIPHSVLYHAPEVTDIFVEYFLKSSTDVSVMPKRLLVEGRKNRFDPWGLVDEYTMYDRLVALLARQGKLIKYSEYDGYTWAAGWSPKLVADEFAMVMEEDEAKSES